MSSDNTITVTSPPQPDPDDRRHATPCPACGHCPACGRGGPPVQPLQPIWIQPPTPVPWPDYPWTWTTTGGTTI